MAGPDRQFDPVANAALGAVRASNRTAREIEKKTPLPEMSARSQIQRSLRDGINRLSGFSPFNILAGQGSVPSPGELMDGDSESAAIPDGLPTPGSDQSLPALSELSPQSVVEKLQDSPFPTPSSGDDKKSDKKDKKSSSDDDGSSDTTNGDDDSRRARSSSGTRSSRAAR